jgi:hypothetical protein
MPVITRSQSKKAVASEVQPVITRTQVINLNTDAVYIEMRDSFVSTVNRLLQLCSSAEGKENKMRVALEVFQIVNRCLPKLVEDKKGDVFIRFAATIFNKTTEMLEDEEQCGWAGIDKALVKKFKTELLKSREFTGSFVKASSVSSPHECVTRARAEIAKMEKSRPRRAVMRVDYRDMEPEF